MAGSGSHRGWWIAVPILLFFAATGLFWPVLDGGLSAPDTQHEDLARANAYTDSVQVESWNWKRNSREGCRSPIAVCSAPHRWR